MKQELDRLKKELIEADELIGKLMNDKRVLSEIVEKANKIVYNSPTHYVNHEEKTITPNKDGGIMSQLAYAKQNGSI